MPRQDSGGGLFGRQRRSGHVRAGAERGLTRSRAPAAPPRGAGRPRGSPSIAPRLALFYAAVFTAIGVHVPFWPVWLSARGMSATEIGILLSTMIWMRAIANLVVADIADRRGERRRPMLLMSLASVVSYALFAPAHGFWALFGVSVLAGLFSAAVVPLGESLTIASAYRHGLDYGRIRLWGSVSFVAAAAGTGWLLGGRSADLVLWLMIASLAATAGACLVLPDVRFPVSRRRRGSMLALARNPLFLAFLATSASVQASHGVFHGFATLHWRASGLGEAAIGWLWAIGVIAEVLLFAASAAVLRRVGPAALLAIAGAAGVLRWSATAFTTDLALLIPIQALHALTFGAAHLAAIHFLQRAAPAELSATAQSLHSAIAWNVIGGAALWVSGVLYAHLAGHAFLVMALLSAAGFAGALWLGRRWDGRTLALGD
ncbi:MAG: MFS transporter [Alphaproteobacteria bacterium]